MNVTKFHVDGLKDSNDVKSLRGELQSLEGVHAVRVDDVSKTITVEYADGLNTEKLTNAISKYSSVRH